MTVRLHRGWQTTLAVDMGHLREDAEREREFLARYERRCEQDRRFMSSLGRCCCSWVRASTAFSTT